MTKDFGKRVIEGAPVQRKEMLAVLMPFSLYVGKCLDILFAFHHFCLCLDVVNDSMFRHTIHCL